MNTIRYFSLLLILPLYLLQSGCDFDKSTPPQPTLQVSVMKIQQTAIPVTKDYIGVTSSMSNVDIRARVQGFLKSYNFVEGTIVKQNQLLYVIEPEPFKAAVDSAQGQLDESIANAEFDKLNAERQYILYKKQAVSEQESDQATATYKAALGTVETNKANLEQAKINLSYCYVYSPITGMIGETQVDVGNLVGGSEATILANVVQLDPIYVSFNPSVNDYAEILKYKSKNPFKVEVTLPQQSGYLFTGEVDLVNNQVATDTSTLLMRSEVSNPKNLLLPGLYVNVKLILGTNPNAILVPAAAVMSDQSLQHVYTLNAKNEVVATRITSHIQYENYLVVDSGLKPGDIVITNNLQKIRPGITVSPTTSTTTTDTKS